MKIWPLLCLLAPLIPLASFADGQGSHQKLDWFPDSSGSPAPIAGKISNWGKRRAEILKEFEKVAGKLPDRSHLPPLDIRVSEAVETDQYTRQTISFASEPGDRITAYLYLPKGIKAGEKRAGIVALHSTHKLGKGLCDGQSELPNRAYAKELAQRGHVVIAPDYPSFGDAAKYDFETDRYQSGTMKGIWNHMRCVDLLRSRDDVDPEKIATIGHSLGGHNAIFLGLFDQRVKVVVSSCGWTPFHDYKEGKIEGWTSPRYMPSLRDRYHLDPDAVPFDFYELIAALAPRAFFSNSPLRDSNFDWRGVEKAAPQIRSIYDLYHVPEKMRITYPDANHDFPESVRLESYEFLEKWLK